MKSDGGGESERDCDGHLAHFVSNQDWLVVEYTIIALLVISILHFGNVALGPAHASKIQHF